MASSTLASSKFTIPTRSLGQRVEVPKTEFSTPKALSVAGQRAPSALSDTEIDLSKWTLHDKIGQLLIVGYRSPQQIRKLKVGGLVLFAWNLGDRIEDTRRIVEKIKKEAAKNLKAPLFLATDQEGGRVLRIREGMTPFPDAAAMGAMQDPYLAFKVGKAMGLELASLGLNMNFAPVLDLGNAKSFLGNRIWGDRADRVGFPAVSYIRGQRAAGIVDVAKHFPGHGRTGVDSHFGLPQIQKTREDLLREDLAPFRLAIGEGVMALMTAHVEYPKIAAGPASLSSIFLTDILRKDLGFEGIVITDDLEMDGAKKGEKSDYGKLALQALKAGTDMILLVWSKERQEAIFNSVEAAIKSGELSEAWLDEKVRRILAVKKQSIGLSHETQSNPFWRENLRRRETLELARDVSSRAIRWLAGPEDSIRKDLSEQWDRPWTVYLPQRSFRRMWLEGRPHDKVYVYSSRGRDRDRFMTSLGASIKKKGDAPVVVLTPPRRDMNEKLFWHLGRTLGRQATAEKRLKSVLWVHQGLQPVLLRPGASSAGLGMLSLYSGSELSIEALQAQLSREAPR